MWEFQTLIPAIALCGLLMVTAPGPVLSQAVQLVTVDVNVVARGYRVSKLTGNTITNEKNERIGTLDDFVIGRDRSLFCDPSGWWISWHWLASCGRPVR
jgi:hypothetical protein